MKALSKVKFERSPKEECKPCGSVERTFQASNILCKGPEAGAHLKSSKGSKASRPGVE